MKTKIEVQFQERNVDVKDTEKLVKEDLKASGVKMNTIANLDIYYQPAQGDRSEERRVGKECRL